MTFAAWYATHVEPGMLQAVNQIPDKAARAVLLKNSRDAMAACWNAALGAAFAVIEESEGVSIEAVYAGALLELKVKA